MFEAGTILAGKYQIVEKIGMGGMGAVYRAREIDFDVDRSVAIKVLPPHLVSDEKLVKRFHEEIKILARMDHPNIVPVYFVGQEQDYLFYVMKYLRGETLKARIRRTDSLPPDLVADIMIQIGRAVDYIHKNGAIHRDIKSVNIMLDEQDNATLMDFGIAKIAGGANLTADGEVLGTAPYMAPEQWEGRNDRRSDIYALGILMYEMLTGSPPFAGQSLSEIMAAHLRQMPLPLRTIRPNIPEELAAVVHRCLAKAPEDRFATAADLVAALTFVDRTMQHAAAPASVPAIGLEQTVLMTDGPEGKSFHDPLARADRLVAAGEPRKAYEVLLDLTPPDSTHAGFIEKLEELRDLAEKDEAVRVQADELIGAAQPDEARVLLEKHLAEYPASKNRDLLLQVAAGKSNGAALAPTVALTPKEARRIKKSTALPAKKNKWVAPIILGGAVVFALLLVGLTFLANETTSSVLTRLGDRLFESSWYVRPPLLNASTCLRLAYFYDDSNLTAKNKRHEMAIHLVRVADGFARQENNELALRYYGWAIQIENNPAWVKTYNKIYESQRNKN
ncbi:MAG: serine/threonine protein kinase [Myxococcales bacterium]|nr:serine/threonine protein kinase [Myxococcales bacterium]